MSSTPVVTNDQTTSSWILYFLAFLPFIVLGSRVSADLTASLSAGFLLLYWYKNPESLVRKQAWFKVILVLWFFMLVTSFFSADPQYVFIQSFIFIRWPAFSLVLACVLFTDESRLRLFEKSALILFIFIALDSIFQYCTGADIFGHISLDPTRLTGPFSKLLPGSYALRIYPMVLMALIYLLKSKHLSKPIFLSIMVLMVAFSEFFAFLTGERVVFVLFSLVNTTLLAALIYQERPSYKFILGAVSGFVLVAVSSILFSPKMFARTIESMIHQLSNFHSSSYYQVYKMAIQLWSNSPWFGVGTRYYYQSCKALPLELQPKPEGCVVHPHQIYVEWLTQNGIIGLVLFILVLFFVFKLIWQNLDFKNNSLNSAVILVAPVMLFFPFVSSASIQTNNYAGLAWMLLGWSLARSMVQAKNRNSFNSIS